MKCLWNWFCQKIADRFKALRYDEEWRDLVGDNLVLAMFYEIQNLREQLEDAKTDGFVLDAILNQ